MLFRKKGKLNLRRSLVPEGAFLMGSDSLGLFPRWRSVERIFELARIAVVERDGFSAADLESLAGQLPQRYLQRLSDGFLEREPVRVSSSDVRERLEAGQIPAEVLPAPVVAYIRQHALYGTSP